MLTWSLLTTSSQINIIIIINITTYQLKSSIATSTINRTPHIYISFMPEIHTPQVFKQYKSNKDNNIIHHNKYISHHIRQKHSFFFLKTNMHINNNYITSH